MNILDFIPDMFPVWSVVFLKRFERVQRLQLYNNTDSAITLTKSSFLLQERSDMLDSQLIAAYIFLMRILSLLLVDELLQ